MAILAYHSVDHRFDLAATRVTPGQFRNQIETALNRGFTFYTLTDYMKKAIDCEKSIALTFDDGFYSVYQYAFPILNRYNLPATVFVIAGYVGQYDTWDVNFAGIRQLHMEWNDLRSLVRAGWEVGSHTVTHRDLTRLNETFIFDEAYKSKVILESKLDIAVNWISYPFGNVNSAVVDICRNIGYTGGVVMGRAGKGIDNDFALRRSGIYIFDTRFTYTEKIFQKRRGFYNFLQKCIDFCSDGTVIVKQGLFNKHKNST